MATKTKQLLPKYIALQTVPVLSHIAHMLYPRVTEDIFDLTPLPLRHYASPLIDVLFV